MTVPGASRLRLGKVAFLVSFLAGSHVAVATQNLGAAGNGGHLLCFSSEYEAVRAWLVERTGVGASRLATAGRGLTQPVADNSTEEGCAINRRVEVVRKG